MLRRRVKLPITKNLWGFCSRLYREHRRGPRRCVGKLVTPGHEDDNSDLPAVLLSRTTHWCSGMRTYSILRSLPTPGFPLHRLLSAACAVALLAAFPVARAQDDPLNKVHVPP